MYLTHTEFAQLDEAGLREFLAREIDEDLYLDYKVDLSGSSDKETKREFLKDVTAFANAHGGLILIGAKEPRAAPTVEERLPGIPDGDRRAQDLERLASSSIDPRVPGLRFRPLRLTGGTWCVAVYVPPSLGRPHMVCHRGHRAFYIRHTESSDPMSTHEIRESVITSLSAEDRARAYMRARETDARSYYLDHGNPLFLVQVMPLIELENPIDLTDEHLIDALRGEGRRDKRWLLVDLCSGVLPTPTIDGLLGRDSREDTGWWTEVHRNGYIGVAFRNQETATTDARASTPCVHRGHCELFRALLALAEESFIALGVDLPCVVGSVYLRAAGTVFLLKDRSSWRETPTYDRDELRWPLHHRAVGQDWQGIAEQLCLEFYNAFGLPFTEEATDAR